MIVPGRVIAVIVLFPDLVLMFVCIHNCPTWSHIDRMAYFRRIKDCVPDSIQATTFLIGDLNFSYDTIRFNGLRPDSSTSQCHKALAALWERFFSCFIEVAQDCPTFTRGTYLSQLDHSLNNILPAVLVDLSPSSWVAWEFGDPLGTASDHCPLVSSIGGAIGNRVSSIPRWVPKHPDFYRHCMILHSKTRLPCGPPLVVLDRHKYIIKEAARLTLSSASSSGFPINLEQKIYWSMILLRHRFDSSNRQFQKSLKAYPHLESYVSNTQGFALLDIRALCLHIDELQYSKATGDLADLPSGPDVC